MGQSACHDGKKWEFSVCAQGNGISTLVFIGSDYFTPTQTWQEAAERFFNRDSDENASQSGRWQDTIFWASPWSPGGYPDGNGGTVGTPITIS
jgi:hypothetical protein